jgi:glutamate 5-kinase
LELSERKKWLAFFPAPKGSITADSGAADAIVNQGGSLLSYWHLILQGDFEKADVVEIVDSETEYLLVVSLDLAKRA